MVGLSSVAAGIPVADLTYDPSFHTLPDYSVGTFQDPANQFSPIVAPAVESAPFNNAPASVIPEVIAPAEQRSEAPVLSPTLRHYEHLGATNFRKLENADVVLFEVQRFPYSDVGACELAIVVLSQLKSMEVLSSKPIVVHIGSVDYNYHEDYSGQQQPVHALYPCCLLDQALPLGTPFKIVSDNLALLAALRESGYHSFIAESVDQAMLESSHAWRHAGSFGDEPMRLPSQREALENGLSALENRRAQSLSAAKAFIPPPKEEPANFDQSQSIRSAA